MGKASVIIYIAVALLLLFIISRHPEEPKTDRNRRLRLRPTFLFDYQHHEHVAFDPLIADMELRREGKKRYFDYTHMDFKEKASGTESQKEREEFVNSEDFLNDEDRLDIPKRLTSLFQSIDVDPVDGFVTKNEFTHWILKQGERTEEHMIRREMEFHDKNSDGFVSFAEYNDLSSVQNADNTSFGYDMGWWKEDHFNASDADGDGLLNQTEFNDFYHTADSNNPKLMRWLCKEKVREKDKDQDGKINFKEFIQLISLVTINNGEGLNFSRHTDASIESSEKILFSQLDQDDDGYLSEEELLPIIGRLHPTKQYYAKQQARYLITQADKDNDRRLTLAEMINSSDTFYSIADDEEDDYDFRDEFR